MLGSPNLYRGNAPLTMRLKIHDLHAQLEPLERYGVGALSFAVAGGVHALVRGMGSVLRCAFCSGEDSDSEPVRAALMSPRIRLRRSAVNLPVAFERRIQ